MNLQQPKKQAWFRSRFSTYDHLQTINQLIEKTTEYQLDLCLAFIDYRKILNFWEILLKF